MTNRCGRLDRIVLRGISATGHHGVLDFERRDGQRFVVDVVMELDLTRAGRTDALDDTVSYAEVADAVVARIAGEPFDLIERLAAVIAADVLARPLVQVVEVGVHKPDAPVGPPFTDVHVLIRRERGVPVVIALGANLGDVAATLAGAVSQIGSLPGLRVDAVSPLFETDPVGGPEQPPYLNAVVLAHTSLAPRDLLGHLHAVEARHGRKRDLRWGARTLDLDLVQYGEPGQPGEVVSEEADLTLPHPRAGERAFVLRPWAVVDPEARLGAHRVAELLDGLDGSGVRAGPAWSPTW